MNRLPILIFAGMLIAVGCAPASKGPTSPLAGAAATTAPSAAQLRAAMPLSEIPLPPFPAYGRPTTLPAEPPIESLQLYARAMDELADDQTFRATQLLQKAIELDPTSYELYMALGKAELERTGRPNALGLDALEHAVAIKPNEVEARLLLGESYLKQGAAPRAIDQFRHAIKTVGYRIDELIAARVDYELALALQSEGYDQAALDRYLILIQRLQNPDHHLSGDPEIRLLIAEPRRLWVSVGLLYERRGKWELALEVFESLARLEPSNFDLQAKAVEAQLSLGRDELATRRAADVVMRFRASHESVALLREVFRKLGKPEAIVAVLRRLHEQAPGDRGVLFAYADTLAEQGQLAAGIALLEDARRQRPADGEILAKLFDAYSAEDQVGAAAALLIGQAAINPDSLDELAPLWDRLFSPTRVKHLRLSAVQKLQVPPSQQTAKLYVISRMADGGDRFSLGRSSLEAAVKLKPPFAPAYRASFEEIKQRIDWDITRKLAASEELATTAQNAGDMGLAEEIRGRARLITNDPSAAEEAIARFRSAQAHGNNSRQLQLNCALLLLQTPGNSAQGERALWKIVSDHPGYGEAWTRLYEYFVRTDSDSAAAGVLDKWLASDPGSVEARLTEVGSLEHYQQVPAAEAELLQLLADHPDNAGVLQGAEEYFERANRLEELIDRLEKMRQTQPRNLALVEELISLYTLRQDTAAAMRALDSARVALAGDPDLLYIVAHMYDRIDQKQTTEQVLEQVVKLDPTNAAASNDLGYTWADEQRNIVAAEALIRVAVTAEPDNQAFLDSLAWVLYKQSKFDQAVSCMRQALSPANPADPVILDHFGDILYRQGNVNDAMAQWRLAQQRLEEGLSGRPDLRDLPQQLELKLSQAQVGQPAAVAPIMKE